MLSEYIAKFDGLGKSEIDSLLKKDLRYLMVFLMAGIKPVRHLDEIEDLFTERIISKSEFRALRDSLLKHEYWQLDPVGNVLVKREHIDLGDLSLHEFTNMTLNLLSRVSEDGPCNCENLFVVTTDAIKKEFYQNVNKALKSFIQASKDTDGDRLVAWTHIGLDCGTPEKLLPGPLFTRGNS